MSVKKCFVPTCPNTSENCVDKVFIIVPRNKEIRTRWFSAVNKPITSTNEVYCCEDHFDLEADMENWMQFKFIGSRIRMKREIVPHKFLDERKPNRNIPPQLTPAARKRRMETLESLKEKSKRKVQSDKPCNSLVLIPTMLQCSNYLILITEAVKQDPNSHLVESGELVTVKTEAEDDFKTECSLNGAIHIPNENPPVIEDIPEYYSADDYKVHVKIEDFASGLTGGNFF